MALFVLRRCLIFGRALRLLPYVMCTNRERLWQDKARLAFSGHLCDKYHNRMSWLIILSYRYVLARLKFKSMWTSKMLWSPFTNYFSVLSTMWNTAGKMFWDLWIYVFLICIVSYCKCKILFFFLFFFFFFFSILPRSSWCGAVCVRGEGGGEGGTAGWNRMIRSERQFNWRLLQQSYIFFFFLQDFVLIATWYPWFWFSLCIFNLY